MTIRIGAGFDGVVGVIELGRAFNVSEGRCVITGEAITFFFD
jgi:hypothetical protein